RFSETDGLREADTFAGILRIEHAAIGKDQTIAWHVELEFNRLGQLIARALGGLNRRVAHHQRDAARVRPEIHGCQIRVSGHRSDVVRIDAQYFGNARHQDIVGALTDFGGAAERGDAAAAIELELYARVRHVVPVDREAGAR